MRFEVRKNEKSKKADYEVLVSVVTEVSIIDKDRVVSKGHVRLNHKDQCDLRIAVREALKRALKHQLDGFRREGRAPFWEAYCKAFSIKTKEGHDLKHGIVSMGEEANA